MSPLYSDKDKAEAIEKFIYARSKKLATINNYTPITNCIAEGRIKLLLSLEKSGSSLAGRYPYEKMIFHYTDSDARIYVEQLISIVSGTEEDAVSEEIFKKAVNQLFMFIFGLTGTLQSSVELLAPYSLDKRLVIFQEQISVVEKRVDHMDEQIMDTLEKILKWQKEYQPDLDDMKKERKERDDIAKSLKGNGTIGKKGNL